MKYPARGFIVLLAFYFAFPALATVRNVQTYGATGNGSTDDRAAINSAIAALVGGDELYFPCPSSLYLISSALNTIAVNNVTIDGQTGCSNGRVTIKDTNSGSTIMQIGNGNLSATTPITASTAELDTSFQANFSAIGAGAGDYVFLTELNDIQQGSGASGSGHCSVSGCRAEVLKLASVSGSTGTVTTAVHYVYDPNNDSDCPQAGGCAPTVQKLTNPITGISVHDLTFDGGGASGVGLEGDGLVNATFTNLKFQNIQYSGTNFALDFRYGFNNSFTNIEATNNGGTGCCSTFGMYYEGNPRVNGVSLHNSVGNTFGFNTVGTSNGTISNITVDWTGNTSGRPFKTTG